MDLTESPLHDEIIKIISDETKRPFYTWKFHFRIRKPNNVEIAEADITDYVDEEEKDGIFKPLKITNIDFVRDYEQNAADEGSINITMGMGMWYKILQPYRDYLELVLKRIPQKEEDRTDDEDQEEEIEVFYAIPKIDPSQVGTSSMMDKYSRHDLDSKGLVDIEFQLLDLSTEKLRAITVGGIFRKVKPEDLIKGILAKETEDVMLGDDGPAVETIKMTKADNTEQREHILIPQGTKLLDVPHYVQRFCGGVYSTGINIYLQNKDWYIFPPYNLKRLEEENRTLTILKIPDMVYDDAERTYRKDGDKLIIMATSDSQFDDKGDEDFKVDGNGIRFADARFFMDSLVETKDNKAIAKRSKINHEFLFKEMKINDEQNNNVQLSQQAIHANPYFENTRLALREGNYIAFRWKNSDASMLYPGMPVKILYMKNDELKEMRGSLLKAHLSVQLSNKGITSNDYRQQTALFVYAKKVEEDES